MDLGHPDVAVEYGRNARAAFVDAGGVELARKALNGTGVREEVATLLEDLGIDSLDVGASAEHAFAAAEICRVAGSVALPYPVAGRAAAEPGTAPIAIVDPDHPYINHGDLLSRWRVMGLDGESYFATPVHSREQSVLGPFLTPVELDQAPRLEAATGPMAMALGDWGILGAVEAALDLTVKHVKTREQFGQPLGAFQAVRFAVADMFVDVRGLRVLADYTISRIHSAPDDAWTEALALHLASAEIADSILRMAHQLTGAIGFCDEHDLSILTRCTQAAIRVPLDLEATNDLLADQIEACGFASLYDGVEMPHLDVEGG